MAKGRGTRLVAKRLRDDTAEVNNLDYFGQFIQQKRLKNDRNDQGSTSKGAPKQPDDRAARIARREAVKLGQTRGVRGQVVSSRQGTAQRSENEDSESQSGIAAGDDDDGDNDDEDEDAGTDGVDHTRITQAINQARNRTMRPTINGIGSRQQGNQPQDDGEDSQEELESQSQDGEEVSASRNAEDRSGSRHGANGKAPQQKKQGAHNGGGGLNQKDQANVSSHDEDESEAESSNEIDYEIAEDTAFVEAPEQGERTVTVQVFINSMGGILKTLQRPAWTGSTHWVDEFESYDNDDGQRNCKTSRGKALMDEIQGLNDILEEAVDPPEDPFDDGRDHDPTTITTAYLRTKSMDIQQHLTRIDKIVDEICSRKLLPVTQDATQDLAAQLVKRRQALLRDMSRRLVPMLIITVKKACGICQPEANGAKTKLYLDCFRLQFFLRPLGWADRLHKALERGLQQWPSRNESHGDADDPALGPERKARLALEEQLAALYSRLKSAGSKIDHIATQAERQQREAEIERRERGRRMERQREIAAEKQREQEEQRRKDEKAYQVFFEATQALRSRKDPLKELWEQDQATLPEKLRAAYTVRATQGGNSSAQGQRAAGAARSQGGPSRRARVESVSDSDDPFSANYRHRSNAPVSNRHASSNGVRQPPLSGLRTSQQVRSASRPWSDEEDKAMIRAIRYKRNYDVVSMAQKLGRSEDDVARKAAFLKQGYREAYTEKGREIPAWAL